MKSRNNLLLIRIFLLGLTLSVAACGNEEAQEKGADEQAKEDETSPDSSDEKTGQTNNEGFVISGKVAPALAGGRVELRYMAGPNQIEVKSSTVIKEDGAYELTGKVDQPTIHQVGFFNNKSIEIVVTNDSIGVGVDSSSGSWDYSFVGSQESTYLRDYFKFSQEFKPNDPTSEEGYRALIEEMTPSFVGLLAAGDYYNYTTQKGSDNFPFLKKVADKYAASDYKSDFAQDFIQRIATLDPNFLAPGSMAPDFELPTPDGRLVKLSEYRGKVVLVDFWASWCRPCRMENPNVVNAYKKYNAKGFDVLGVSLDRERESWLKAIEADQLAWTHVSDLKFWQCEAGKIYGVRGIPFSVLVGKDGKIIDKNLRGPALDQTLAKLF